MPRIALLSNPNSTGNRALLPRVRSFCAQRSDIFHYEVEDVSQIGEALRTIARVRPAVLVVNGGDGTVQTTLTEMHLGGWFGEAPPPVAVLPNGKTNLIALDLGAGGDPIRALERVLVIARDGVEKHVITRELIALSQGPLDGTEEGGTGAPRPVLGMFLGGGGLADSMLFCRQKVYPLGLPNGLSHVLTAVLLLLSLVLGVRAAFLPPRPGHVKVSLIRQGQHQGRFSLLIVTTLERMLIGTRAARSGGMKLMLVDHRPFTLIRAIAAGLSGRLERTMAGVHVGAGDEIRIEGVRSSVILDGEVFRAEQDRPIVLRQTAPVPFLRIAA